MTSTAFQDPEQGKCIHGETNTPARCLVAERYRSATGVARGSLELPQTEMAAPVGCSRLLAM